MESYQTTYPGYINALVLAAFLKKKSSLQNDRLHHHTRDAPEPHE